MHRRQNVSTQQYSCRCRFTILYICCRCVDIVENIERTALTTWEVECHSGGGVCDIYSRRACAGRGPGAACARRARRAGPTPWSCRRTRRSRCACCRNYVATHDTYLLYCKLVQQFNILSISILQLVLYPYTPYPTPRGTGTHRIHLTSSSCPSSTRMHCPHSMSHRRMVLSEEPDTTRRSRYCRHAMPRLCPFNVRTNSQDDVFHTCNTELC